MMTETRPRHEPTEKKLEYLANERTFSAWIRTGLATIGLGFVIARFSFWLREISGTLGGKNIPAKADLSLPIGLGLVAFGALMSLISAFRYRTVRRAIEQDIPQPRSVLVPISTGGIMLLSVILIIYLLLASGQF